MRMTKKGILTAICTVRALIILQIHDEIENVMTIV